MTSSGVSNVLQTLTLTKAQGTGNVSQTSQDFVELLNSKTAPQMQFDSSQDTISFQKDTVEKLQQSYEKGKNEVGYKDMSNINEVSEEPADMEQLQEDYEELKEAVMEVLTAELNVTEEELIQAMETLGITFADILQGNGLADLMLEITGGENMAELLFNDTFRELMQQVEQLVSQFVEQSDLTPEELDMLLEQLNTQNVQQETVESVPEDTSVNQVLDGEAENVKLSQTEEVATQTEETMDSVEAEPGKNVQPKEAMTNGQDATADSQSETGEELKQNKTSSNQQTVAWNESSQAQGQVSYQTVQNQVNITGQEMVQVVEQTFIDVEDIMNQITEFSRVTIEQSQTSIEMQLNPEHLGKIYLQVVSKEGMITAQLAAQNEAVKQALESQVAVLKENMNQQGIKVEAVEVTIASHEFEQNLESGRQPAEQQEEQGETKTRRFLTAEQLDELAGTLSEEESLAARIMLENGNSMDMTV